MNTTKFKPSILLIATIIIAFASLRVLFPNLTATTGGFTSVGAITMFAAAMFSNRFTSIFIPVAIMFISDIFINVLHYNNGIFYSGWYFTYIAFALMAVASNVLLKKVTGANLVLTTIVTTAIHWVFTSVVYWFGHGIDVATQLPLPYTANGLAIAHIQAIPFELKLLTGTALYSALMFGIYYFAQKEKTALAYAKA